MRMLGHLVNYTAIASGCSVLSIWSFQLQYTVYGRAMHVRIMPKAFTI